MRVGIRELSEPTWQPIETAPKDGETYLIYDRLLGVLFMHWYDGDGDDEEAGWCVQDFVGDYIIESEPTHWMPLPPPPVGSGRSLADANSKSPIQAREE